MYRPFIMLLCTGLVAGCAAKTQAPSTIYQGRGGSHFGAVPRARINLPGLDVSESTSARRVSAVRRRVLAGHATSSPVDNSPQPAPPSPSRMRRLESKPSPAPTSTGASGSGGSRSRRAARAPRPPRGSAVRTVSTGPRAGAGGAHASTPTVAKGARVGRTRLIIYRGTLVLRVFKADDAVNVAQRVALQTGAYIQSRNNRQLVIRVPVGRFHELMALLEATGEVGGKSIAARDVTQHYYDVTHRLKASESVLNRLKALLKKAKNVPDSLMIEKEMSRLLVRIERYKGMLRYLQHHASLSTIVVYFRVKPRHARPIRSSWRSPFGWVKSLGLWRMMRF